MQRRCGGARDGEWRRCWWRVDEGATMAAGEGDDAGVAAVGESGDGVGALAMRGDGLGAVARLRWGREVDLGEVGGGDSGR